MALNDAPLGKSSDYPDAYDPQLLFPVARDFLVAHRGRARSRLGGNSGAFGVAVDY